MDLIINGRNEFFQMVGKSRIKRILFLAFFIAIIWMGVDYFVYDNLAMNLKHDIIVLVFGIIAERLIPWGKPIRVAGYEGIRSNA